MRRRARGFTLMEILIAMALTTIVTASVLAIVRTQLSTFEMNDQVMRTQQNARAAMDFVESVVRRACGGVASGPIGVNTATVHKQIDCFNFVDSAAVSSTSFSTSGTTFPDAIEVVYATGTMTALSAVPNLSSSQTITVNDITGFSANDLVLVSDYNTAYLMQVFSVAATGTGTTRPIAGTITFTSTATTAPTTGVPTLAVGSPVFKAATYSFFVAPSNAGNYTGMLMVDPNGVTSTAHTDYGKSVQPAVEGVVDFQVAIGEDNDANGLISDGTPSKASDEWVGNTSGETKAPTSPWNTVTTYPQLRQVRLSLLLATLNKYAGSPPTIAPFENSGSTSYPVSTSTYGYRYRTASMVVAPRAWNLSE